MAASVDSLVHVGRVKRKRNNMKLSDEFDFKRSRRVTPRETEMFRKAIEKKLGIKRPPRGRPPKKNKYLPTSIRLHPLIIAWAKEQAKKRGVGYQTIINETLLKAVI